MLVYIFFQIFCPLVAVPASTFTILVLAFSGFLSLMWIAAGDFADIVTYDKEIVNVASVQLLRNIDAPLHRLKEIRLSLKMRNRARKKFNLQEIKKRFHEDMERISTKNSTLSRMDYMLIVASFHAYQFAKRFPKKADTLGSFALDVFFESLIFQFCGFYPVSLGPLIYSLYYGRGHFQRLQTMYINSVKKEGVESSIEPGKFGSIREFLYGFWWKLVIGYAFFVTPQAKVYMAQVAFNYFYKHESERTKVELNQVVNAGDVNNTTDPEQQQQ